MENTVSEDLGGKIKWGTTVSIYPERDLLTPVHCTLGSYVLLLCMEDKNTVRKTRRLAWLTETDTSNPLILFDACCLPAKPKVSLIHV